MAPQKRILTVVGARPQFIKTAPLCRALSKRGIHQTLVHTGQHFDVNMSEIFFEELEIPHPDYNLGVSRRSHGVMTGMMMEKLDPVLEQEAPDIVVVFGDTNSTLAGALSAAKMGIPVAHVEAGLRSFNRRMPEEVNRVLVDHCSDLLFTPTDGATEQLLREGLSEDKIFQAGDVMYDVALYYQEKAQKQSSILETLGLRDKEYTLATVHRQENVDDPVSLNTIFDALVSIARKVPVVLPLHPRTRKALEAAGSLEEVSSAVRIIDPVGYLDMCRLQSSARVILTDSGGVQKEGYFAQVPCLVLRNETEWTELVNSGHNRLSGVNKSRIEADFREIWEMEFDWSKKPYGAGNACEGICERLLQV